MQIASEAPSAFRTSAHRPGGLSLVATAWREAMSRRRLMQYLIQADVKKKGTDTILGNVWWLLDPLLAMAVYVFVMQVIFQRRIEDFPLYLLAAVIPFKWFTQTVGDSVSVVSRNGSIIKQISFPKIVLVLAGALSEVISFAFGMTLLIVMSLVLYGGHHLSLQLLWIPVIAAVQFVFTLGFVLIISAVTVFYRDVGIIIGHLMRLLFFLSPVLWSLDAGAGGRGDAIRHAVGHTGFLIVSYNPIAILLTSYRHVIFGVVGKVDPVTKQNGWTPPIHPDLRALFFLAIVSVVLLVVGTGVFKRLEPAFAKVL
jgi:lipopolysaccharide transport system permease protein/teichoic acid transport system permease protein